MDKELYRRCDNVCQIMATFDYVGNEGSCFLEELCRANGIKCNDIEIYYYEVFGMSSSEIFEAFNNM